MRRAWYWRRRCGNGSGCEATRLAEQGPLVQKILLLRNRKIHQTHEAATGSDAVSGVIVVEVAEDVGDRGGTDSAVEFFFPPGQVRGDVELFVVEFLEPLVLADPS